PVHGAQTFVDEAVFVKRKKSREHHRLVLRSHRGIGSVKTPEDADALELLPLQIKKFLRVLRHSARTSVGRICNFLPPSSLSTLISMGSPWQSQPGTYGASNPAMVFDLTMKSFKHLFIA